MLILSDKKDALLLCIFVYFFCIHDLKSMHLQPLPFDTKWLFRCVYCCKEFIWRHLRYGTTAKAWDDNVKVDWKRRHKESFYPPQAAECGTRKCKAGIDLGTEKTETGGRECNEITGWWEKMRNWRLRMRHDLNQKTRTQPITQTRPGHSFN